MLTMFPIKKAELLEAIDPVGPLCRVRAKEIEEEKVSEEQLDHKQAIVFKFLKQQYLKCFKIT